jgi:hypothetical protein
MDCDHDRPGGQRECQGHENDDLGHDRLLFESTMHRVGIVGHSGGWLSAQSHPSGPVYPLSIDALCDANQKLTTADDFCSREREPARCTWAAPARFGGVSIRAADDLSTQTFIDTYARVGFAKLYDRKMPITAADLLNGHVIPL